MLKVFILLLGSDRSEACKKAKPCPFMGVCIVTKDGTETCTTPGDYCIAHTARSENKLYICTEEYVQKRRILDSVCDAFNYEVDLSESAEVMSCQSQSEFFIILFMEWNL